jgi:hypothetical protein
MGRFEPAGRWAGAAFWRRGARRHIIRNLERRSPAAADNEYFSKVGGERERVGSTVLSRYTSRYRPQNEDLQERSTPRFSSASCHRPSEAYERAQRFRKEPHILLRALNIRGTCDNSYAKKKEARSSWPSPSLLSTITVLSLSLP